MRSRHPPGGVDALEHLLNSLSSWVIQGSSCGALALLLRHELCAAQARSSSRPPPQPGPPTLLIVLLCAASCGYFLIFLSTMLSLILLLLLLSSNSSSMCVSVSLTYMCQSACPMFTGFLSHVCLLEIESTSTSGTLQKHEAYSVYSCAAKPRSKHTR